MGEGAPVSEPLPMVDLAEQQRRLRPAIDRAIARVLDHGRYVMGPEVAELEDRLAGTCGAGHVVTCASGTDALLLCLLVHEVGPGDAIFVPDFTFPATAEVVALIGATPVFVDVFEDTFDLDPANLVDAVAGVRRDHPRLRPRGVIVVDLFGQPADHAVIADAAREADLWVVDDAAQSFGAGTPTGAVGTLAPMTTTSFFPVKPLGCYGDGGAVFTGDGEVADRLRSLRVHGQGSHKYDTVRVGINGRLDTLQAAILIEKLAIFPDELRRRRAVADRYEGALTGVVQTPRVRDGWGSAWAQYTVKVDRRDEVADRLRAEGISTAIYYPRPLHAQPAYRDHPRSAGGLSVAERLARRVLSLPMHPYLEPGTQDRVIDGVRRAVGAE